LTALSIGFAAEGPQILELTVWFWLALFFPRKLAARAAMRPEWRPELVGVDVAVGVCDPGL